jgi:hypothetical protein
MTYLKTFFNHRSRGAGQMNTDKKDIFWKIKPAAKWCGQQVAQVSYETLEKSVSIRPALRDPWLELFRSDF